MTPIPFGTNNFIGGAIGSTLAAVLWQRRGWPAVMARAATLISVALTVWATQRKRALVITPQEPG